MDIFLIRAAGRTIAKKIDLSSDDLEAVRFGGLKVDFEIPFDVSYLSAGEADKMVVGLRGRVVPGLLWIHNELGYQALALEGLEDVING